MAQSLLSDLNDVLQITRTQPDLPVTLILLQGVRGTLNEPSYQMTVASWVSEWRLVVDMSWL
jgi:hypothetical protein